MEGFILALVVGFVGILLIELVDRLDNGSRWLGVFAFGFWGLFLASLSWVTVQWLG